MSNDTMQSLASHAVDNLPADLVPGLSRYEASSAPLLSDSKASTTVGEDDGSSSLSGTASESSYSTSKTSASETTGPVTHDVNNRDANIVAHSHNPAIDWEAESCPPEDLATLALDHPPQTATTTGATREGMVIVLTGCTGLLGHHLLSRLLLLDNHTIAKVICLAVRSLSSRRQQLPNDPRVVYYEGDLSHSLLGLTKDQATSIFTEADVVIHNAADTSHLKHYTQLHAANGNSTKTLARLCLSRNVPLHYISSAGVAMLHDTGEEKTFSPGPVRLGQDKQPPDGSFGYLCSKWISKQLLERINKSYNLPVYIHRPSTIIRQGADAVGEAAERDGSTPYYSIRKG
ncbi:Male sterility domain containing protein [Rhypophila sp. PSN 637]